MGTCPHLDKLVATLENEKLPVGDKPRLEAAIAEYKRWLERLSAIEATGEEYVKAAVALLNEYRLYIDVSLIFDSPEDFLYRQKGQLKLDNSVIEEFLSRLVGPKVIPEFSKLGVEVGPRTSFSSLFFVSNLADPLIGGGANVREKNQDFAISKPLYIRTSHNAKFEQSEIVATNVTYVAAECKTNLDKTMFQEACATARDTKFAVSGAVYFLLCEWLDMAPLSTAATEIDEIILLRKAKRINSNVRSAFSSASGRQRSREKYVSYLKEHPFRPEMFLRFVSHVLKLIENEAPEEREVLEHGYF